MSREDFAVTLPERVTHLGQIPAVLQASVASADKLPLAIYVCDCDGRILWFNARAAELWGRKARICDDTEKYCGSYKQYFGGRQITRDEAPMAAVLRTGVSVRGAKSKMERPDGSSICVNVHIETVEDQDGNVRGAINCFHEASPAHPADEIDDFFETAAVGLHLVSGTGIILWANRAELQMLGYNAEICRQKHRGISC